MNSLPPVSEDLLIRFVTYCHTALSLKFDTIKLYLAGVRFHYIRYNFGDPLTYTTRLSYILRAIKKNRVGDTFKRFPITCDVLTKLCSVLSSTRGVFEPFIDRMLICVFKTAFYGFLRCGEFTCSKLQDNNFIRLRDINVVPDKSCFHLCLRSSKTDPFGNGVIIKIFENSSLAPVSTMQNFLQLRLLQGANPDSPLFVDNALSSKPLLRGTFISYLKDTLTRVGIDNRDYNGHSFRIGAATSAAAAGVEDHVIQTLGRWSSDCYIRYIRIDPSVVALAQLNMTIT